MNDTLPVSNETRIKQIADELREILNTDNNAIRLIHEQLSGVTFNKVNGKEKTPHHLGWKLPNSQRNF